MPEPGSIQQIVDQVAGGQARAAEAVRAARLHLLESPSPTNAFISLCEPGETVAGLGSSLAGVTYSVKDNIEVAGTTTTCGSRVLADSVAGKDADLVMALRRAGAACLGKNNMHEFALGPTNLNSHFGDVCNPWDLARISGGSSGGSAAAVATGDVHFSIGTDTGGSVRVPASMCGVVGFKPTSSIVSMRGIRSISWSLDNVGVMARTVPDVQLVWRALVGQTAIAPVNAANLRLAYLQDQSMGTIAPDIWACYMHSISRLGQAGYTLKGVSLQGFERVGSAATSIVYPEISSQHAHWIRERPDAYGDDIRPLIQLGEILSARHYVTALRAVSVFRQSFSRQIEGYDALLTPTVPISPHVRHELAGLPIADRKRATSAIARLTVLFSVVGCPAISIPIGFDDYGLPVGMQLVGRASHDDQLLVLAGHVESALGRIGPPPFFREVT